MAADAGGRARFKGKPGEAEGKLKDGFLDVRDVAIGAALYTGVDLIEFFSTTERVGIGLPEISLSAIDKLLKCD